MKVSKILSYIEEHESLRNRGVNLIASENVLSEKARKALSSDLAGRYHASWYGGTKFSKKIVETTEALASELFRARHAIVTSLSGNLCDLAVLFAFTAPGDPVGILPFTAGGYPLGVEKFHRKRWDLPVHKGTYDIDVKAAAEGMQRMKPKLNILGASYLLFPQPVEALAGAMRASSPGGLCVYDGSHVLGLIACGVFQHPLQEGADLLIGSTHKSFFGPQGGLILTNRDEHAAAVRKFLELDLETGIGLVDNPHVNRIAALGLALEEMLEDPGYGKRVVDNAKALAEALTEQGFPVRFKDRGYTESHQILLDLPPEGAEKLCHDLEKAEIYIDIGGRLGTAEVTRRGMGPGDMKEIAGEIARNARL
jgi:glycine hydroxymethyltransferase